MPTNIKQLPSDMIEYEILSLLDTNSLLATRKVDKKFKFFSESNNLWHSHFAKNFPELYETLDKKTVSDWFDHYLKTAKAYKAFIDTFEMYIDCLEKRSNLPINSHKKIFSLVTQNNIDGLAKSFPMLSLCIFSLNHDPNFRILNQDWSFLGLLLKWGIENKKQALLDSIYTFDLENDRYFSQDALHLGMLCSQPITALQTYVDEGVDVNARNENDITTLDTAIALGRVDFIKFLIKNGANLEATDKRLETALHKAATMGNLDYIRVLLDNGANIQALDRFGDTPLDHATLNNHLEAVNLLMERAAEIEAMKSHSSSFLHN